MFSRPVTTRGARWTNCKQTIRGSGEQTGESVRLVRVLLAVWLQGGTWLLSGWAPFLFPCAPAVFPSPWDYWQQVRQIEHETKWGQVRPRETRIDPVRPSEAQSDPGKTKWNWVRQVRSAEPTPFPQSFYPTTVCFIIIIHYMYIYTYI